MIESTPCICVFCGSNDGVGSSYLEAARDLGHRMAASGMGLVYGGASIGLMGTVADAVLAGGAKAIGVLPAVLNDREVPHGGLTRLHFVETMHERKALMASYADAFIALPGGFGTFEEFLEILTWAQLGIHAKPCVLVNTLGYYDGLLRFLDHAVHEGFLRSGNRALIEIARTPEEALSIIERKWIEGEVPPPHDAKLDSVIR